MNDFERFLHATPKEGSEAEDDVRRLLRAAGPRPKVPEEDLAGIERAVRSVWRSQVRARRRRERRWSLALAASLLLALVAGWWWLRAELPSGEPAAATVLSREGGADALGGGRLAAGSLLAPGSVVETRPGERLALGLATGGSVRLDEGSLLRLAAGRRLELEAGALYFDSTGGAAALAVATPFGVVRDVGTRFQVRLDPAAGDRLRVSVRQGAVAFEHDGEIHAANGGEELRLQEDGGVLVVSAPVYGDAWAWVQAAAPVFDIDGRSLAEYLEWVGRETGFEVAFDDPRLAAEASTIVLSGTIEELTPEESLRVVVAGSGLDYRLDGGRLSLSSRP